MGKFRKRPVEIEAIRFTGDNWEEMQKFCGVSEVISGILASTFNPVGTFMIPAESNFATGELWVKANQSWLPIEDGEWVIKDSLGFYPCKDEIFQQNYERVEES